MEIEGFDTYRFKDKGDILYAIKEFQLKTTLGRIKVILELIIHTKKAMEAKITQKNPKNPQFFVKNACEGLLRPIGSTIAKRVRDLLISLPTGDIFEGDTAAIKEVGNAFRSLPIPHGDVVIRIPVVFVTKIKFKDKQGKISEQDRVNFELKPEGYGYVICTGKSINSFPQKLSQIFNSF